MITKKLPDGRSIETHVESYWGIWSDVVILQYIKDADGTIRQTTSLEFSITEADQLIAELIAALVRSKVTDELYRQSMTQPTDDGSLVLLDGDGNERDHHASSGVNGDE